tara:strand:+ start:1458 stop:2081 length:624 start_codon:yes stop_codon:yes gene_type:complete
MKRIFLVLPIALLALATSCGADVETETHEDAVVAENVESKDYTVSENESIVNWSGEGVGHGHNGTISISSGSFTMKEDKIESGEITIDMASMIISDIEDTTENAKLLGHLTTEDFFNIAEFSTASLVIIDGSDMSNVVGNMTIKDVTEEVTFSLSTTEIDGGLELTTTLSIDRTKFGITYNSGNFFEDLGDYLINDNFDLTINLMAK